MVAGTCNPSCSGDGGRRIAWIREAEVAISRDRTIALQPGQRERNSVSKNKTKQTNKLTKNTLVWKWTYSVSLGYKDLLFWKQDLKHEISPKNGNKSNWYFCNNQKVDLQVECKTQKQTNLSFSWGFNVRISGITNYVIDFFHGASWNAWKRGLAVIGEVSIHTPGFPKVGRSFYQHSSWTECLKAGAKISFDVFYW